MNSKKMPSNNVRFLQKQGVCHPENGSLVMRRLVLFLSFILTMLSGCRSFHTGYIREADVLYVHHFGTTDENGMRNEYFLYVDKFNEAKLPKEMFDIPDRKYYKWAFPFSYGLGLVKYFDDTWKYIDKNGNIVIDASNYDRCRSFGEYMGPHVSGFEKLAFVCKMEEDKEKFGLINMQGQLVLPVEYDSFWGGWGKPAYPEYDRIWLVSKNGLYGAVNKKAEIVVPLKYQELQLFSEGYALAKLNDKWGIINKKGKTILSFTLTEIEQRKCLTENHRSRTLAKKGDYWGIIDQKGRTILPFAYTGYDILPDIIRLYKDDGGIITWDIGDDKEVK
jgi:hypothetical protein